MTGATLDQVTKRWTLGVHVPLRRRARPSPGIDSAGGPSSLRLTFVMMTLFARFTLSIKSAQTSVHFNRISGRAESPGRGPIAIDRTLDGHHSVMR